MTAAQAESDNHGGRPPLAGSLAYLLMTLPLGIFWFTLLVTLIGVGISTAIIWVGLGISALAVLVWRAGARFERSRTRSLLRTNIDPPYRPLPSGNQKQRWKTRLRDSSTWRELAYLLLLLPIGVIEFTLVVTCWTLGLALAGLPIYYRFLPGGAYYFPAENVRWITADSVLSALPWAVLGLLIVTFAVVLTKALAGKHARFARAMLGPLKHQSHAAGSAPKPTATGSAATSPETTTPTTGRPTLR